MYTALNYIRPSATILFVPSSNKKSLEASDFCVVGVDLGGTNVRASAYDTQGNAISEKVSLPSNAQSGTNEIFKAISDAVSIATKSSSKKVKAIGMAIPGIVDDLAGIVRWAPNFGKSVNGVFHYWENIEVRRGLEAKLKAPLFMGNDANLAALGEYRFGSGKNNASCLVMLTIGTGIGGGVVLGTQSVRGKAQGPLLLLGGNQGGVELGHTVIQANGLDCSAGTYGAVEAYCQKDSIIKRAQHRLLRKRESHLSELVKGDFSALTPELLSTAAKSGDELAIQVWNEVGAMLGVAIGNMINIFAPEIVAIGGQIAKSGEFLLKPARLAARDVAIPNLFDYARIIQAVQIDDAGMLGGAALALQSINNSYQNE